MKKLELLVASLFILSCTCLQAQTKWHIEPAVGITVCKNDYFGNVNLKAGRVLGEKNRYRLNFWGAYVFDSNISSAVLCTFGESTSTRKFYLTASLGAGIKKNLNKEKIDFIIPVIANLGYNLSKNLLIGIDIVSCNDLNNFKNGSFSSAGLFLGMRF
jgi:hypothetical protein